MNARLLIGDVRDTLRELPDASVHMVCTSPPYWRLRDYGTGTWEGGDPACEHKAGRAMRGGVTAKQATNAGSFGDEFAWECKCGAVRKDRQLGQEPELDCAGWAQFWDAPALRPDLTEQERAYVEQELLPRLRLLTRRACGECYVCHLVEVFREVRRILRDDGTLWLNLGTTSTHKQDRMVPARVALALQADGWYLRREVVWAKGRSFDDEGSGACMPSSVTDAPTYSHEQVFLFSTRERYFYDRFAVAEKGTYAAGTRAAKGGQARRNGTGVNARPAEYAEYSGTRNLRSVWMLDRENETAGHYATFPSGLPKTCIKAGTSEKGVCAACGAPWVRLVEDTAVPDPAAKGSRFDSGKTAAYGCGRAKQGIRTITAPVGWEPSCGCGAGLVPATVLDPFAGLGKTGVVALRLGRSFIGCELSEAFARTAEHRLRRVSRDVEAPELPAPTLGGLFEEVGT